MKQQREFLPIHSVREELMRVIAENQVRVRACVRVCWCIFLCTCVRACVCDVWSRAELSCPRRRATRLS